MPEPLSVHGRCPRCSQLLAVPAGQLQSVFRCARCQYRVPGAALVEEAKASPPRLPLPTLGLGNFDEDSEDQHTRLHLPGSDPDDGETALAAVLVDGASSAPPPRAAPLQRFDDGDDQQTRLHAPGSFAPPQPRARPQAPRRPSPRDATLVGIPSAPAIMPLQRLREDADDQATRVLSPLGDSSADSVQDHTIMGVAPAPAIPGRPPPVLQRFDQVTEDAEDQHTRLQVPISYEEEEAAPPPAPIPPPAPAPPPVDLRPPVAPRPSSPRFEPDEDIFPPRGLERFGRATLQLSRWIDDWLHDQRSVLMLTLAGLYTVIAPALDALFGSRRHAATVIAANLVLFFMWTLLLGWFGRLRNDEGAWDYHVAGSRISSALRLAGEDLSTFGRLPSPLKWRVLAEVSGSAGLFGLGACAMMTLSQLVWSWPQSVAFVFLLRSASALALVFSVVARRMASDVPIGYGSAPEIAAPAVAHFPAVVDLSLPLSVTAPKPATVLHQVLEVLSQWPPREWPNQDSYIAALERHLLRRMGLARVDREQWLGNQRSEGIAHLIVNQGLLVEVVRGFDPEIAQRINARMRNLTKIWRGKPAIIIIFDASRAALLDSAGTPPLEALHQSYPILTVRMPSARVSVA